MHTKLPRKKSQLLLVGGVGVAIVAGAVLLMPKAAEQDNEFEPSFKDNFRQGIAMWSKDRPAAEKLIRSSLEAAKTGAPLHERMCMMRDYAGKLWESDDTVAGDGQIEEVIKLCPDANPKDKRVAMELSEAYEERGWNTYRQFLVNRAKEPGIEDQRKAYAIYVNAWAPDHQNALYKISKLALMYSDNNQTAKADELFKEALELVNTKPLARPAGWYVYRTIGRARASRGDMVGAAACFDKAFALTTDQKRHDRVYQEAWQGLERRYDTTATKTPFNAAKLLKTKKFAELDTIADKLRTAQTPVANGRWMLNDFYEELEPAETEAACKESIELCKEWLQQRPDSATARIAGAQALVHYGWLARGTGYADTVSADGWKQLSDRLASAQALLIADPNIFKKCPKAADVELTIGLGANMPKDDWLNIVEATNKTWPKYRAIDKHAVYGLLPRWLGEPGEWIRFAEKRANTLGGDEGDVLYAQLIAANCNYLDSDDPAREVDWPRTKLGFAKIMQRYPQDLTTRVTFIKLCAFYKDENAMKAAFTSYKAKA